MADRVSFFFLFVFVLSFIASLPAQISAADEADAKEFVLTLDHSNFSDTIKKHDFIVVEFYAPWYGSVLLLDLVFFGVWSVRVLICLVCVDSVQDLTFFLHCMLQFCQMFLIWLAVFVYAFDLVFVPNFMK